MWTRGSFGGLAVFVTALAGLAAGCENDETTFGPPSSCLVDRPCDDDPSKTCKVPCEGSLPPVGNPSGGGGAGGGTSTGGAGGGAVDVLGSVVTFTSAEFDETAPYADPIKIIAPGVDTATVEADVADGTFSLVGAAAGVQWVLAQDSSGGVGGAFSTYSLHNVTASGALVVPVVPVEVLNTIATQISVVGLDSGTAHLVLRISDETGAPLEGVTVSPLGGSTVGYDSGPGFYTSNATGTGNLGLAVALNVGVAGAGTVDVAMTHLGEAYDATIPIAPNAVTYALIGIDLTP